MRRTARRLCIAAGCLCVALSATTFASNVAASLPPDPSRKQTPLGHASMATMLSLMGTTMKMRLPYGIQPGTGTYDLLSDATYWRESGNWNWGVTAVGRFHPDEYAQDDSVGAEVILPVYQNLNGQPLDGNWIVWAGRRKGFSL